MLALQSLTAKAPSIELLWCIYNKRNGISYPHDSWASLMSITLLSDSLVYMWSFIFHMLLLDFYTFIFCHFFWIYIIMLHIMWEDSLTHITLWWHLYKPWLGSSWWCINSKLLFLFLPWYLHDWSCMCRILQDVDWYGVFMRSWS